MPARAAFLPPRLTGLFAGFERAVRAGDFFRPGWTRAFFDKMKTYSAVMRGPVMTWIGRVDKVEPGQ
jgi:hypothetical protein